MLENFVDGHLIRYRPAELTKGKTDWYVHYSAMDPLRDPTGKRLFRKRIKVNHIKSKKERIRYANHQIEQINQKLRRGWTPWLEEQAPKGHILLVEAIGIFLRSKIREKKRPASITSYRSQGKKLREFLEGAGLDQIVCAAFTRHHARQYMEAHLIRTGGSSGYNNTLTFAKLLFNWLKDRQYCVENPFHSIKKLKEELKKRKKIPAEWRKRIYSHLEEADPDFLTGCLLMFYGLLRPMEQIRMNVSHVDLDARLISVPEYAAKNGMARTVTIPDVLVQRLHLSGWQSLHPEAPLIGEKFKLGGKRKKHTKNWWYNWDKMRNALEMPAAYQCYSLRDSGIIYMIENRVPLNDVMQQAGHTDLSITSRYVKHANTEARPMIEGLMSGF